MEAKGETQWSSIIVPSVQEMVKEKMITTVPPRYVQPDQDKSGVTDDSGLIPNIPIIDMKRLCSSTAMDADSEVQKLDLACKEFGFFQAKSLNFFVLQNNLYYTSCGASFKIVELLLKLWSFFKKKIVELLLKLSRLSLLFS